MFSAIVEPVRDSVLIGAIVMEELDFLVDCERQQLVPRDPEQIVSEIESQTTYRWPGGQRKLVLKIFTGFA